MDWLHRQFVTLCRMAATQSIAVRSRPSTRIYVRCYLKAIRSQILATVLVCSLPATAASPASAESGAPIGGVTSADAAWIVAAIVVIGAAIGIGIYYGINHNRSLTGCAVSGTGGFELQNKGDRKTYALVGAVNAIKTGERIRVSGKRVKKTGGPIPQFLVEKVSKDFGPCPANPVTP
jgi:hypothetical protein